MVIKVTCISKLAFTWRSLNLLDCSLLGSRVARFRSSESSPCRMGRSSYSAAAEMISIRLRILVLLFYYNQHQNHQFLSRICVSITFSRSATVTNVVRLRCLAFMSGNSIISFRSSSLKELRISLRTLGRAAGRI